MVTKSSKISKPERVDMNPLLLIDGEILTVPPICKAGAPFQVPNNNSRVLELTRIMLERVYNPIFNDARIQLPVDWCSTDKEMKKNTDKILDTASELEDIQIVLDQLEKYSSSKAKKLLKDWSNPKCSFAVAQTITELAFAFAIPSAKKLNSHYQSFSSETYGETSLEQMASILDELKLGPDDVLVDMGSGVGQLVCFTAAYSNVKKTVGIELEKVPAGYSASLSTYFKNLASHFGKECGEFELYAGDFLHSDFDDLIMREATVIFINNFAFSPDLMNRIVTERLQFLKDGVRIVTSKPLSNYRRGISFRSQNDISALTDASPMKSVESNVSWTNKTVMYTLQTMNSMKLFNYYEKKCGAAQEKAKKSQSRKRKIADDSIPH